MCLRIDAQVGSLEKAEILTWWEICGEKFKHEQKMKKKHVFQQIQTDLICQDDLQPCDKSFQEKMVSKKN